MSQDKLTANIADLTINSSGDSFASPKLSAIQRQLGGWARNYGSAQRQAQRSKRIAMRPRNALGYRRHPFRQHGDIDHARRVRFPSLPQQLSADLRARAAL